MKQERILIVDDEPTSLAIYEAQLDDLYSIDTAVSGADGLRMIRENEAYAVVISDMHMPEMNGAEFLAKVQELSPESIRVMLTGEMRQAIAVEAVNEGQIFRFLNKPCPTAHLTKAIADCVRQYRLLRSEKELLGQTLGGSIKVLVEILSVVSPLAFGRAIRVKELVAKLCEHSDVASAWEVHLAAVLSQIGCISLPKNILEKVHYCARLTNSEQREFDQHPMMGRDLIAKIPRLEAVSQLIAAQNRDFDSPLAEGEPADLLQRAAFLKVALDYDHALQSGQDPEHAIALMKATPSRYSSELLKVLRENVVSIKAADERTITLAELQVGMVLRSDIVDDTGALLVTNGQAISPLLFGNLMQRRSMVSGAFRVLDLESSGQPATMENEPALSN